MQRPRARIRPLGVLLTAALPLTILAPAPDARTAQAAGVDPLPAVARALAHVTSYQVTIQSTTTGSGRPPSRPRSGRRPSRGRRPGQGLGFGPGARTETIVAVRKGSGFEDYVVLKGTGTTGKPTTRAFVVYGAKICTRSGGTGAYTCQAMQQPFNDPTTAFEAGAGSAVFTPTRAATIGGQACDGYTYTNKFQNGTASGVVYIARATNLPCKQIATTTRRAFTGSGTFTQKSTMVWSRFNDRSLTVPSIPA